MASELRILGRRKRLFHNKLKTMYTIEDFKKGKCAVKNDGTLEELNSVLTYAYPNMGPSSGGYKYYISTGDDWMPVMPDELPCLPTQSVKDFLNQINKPMRKITWQQAQRIIDAACHTWKTNLSEKWGSRIVCKLDIEISEEFYREMRSACTDTQHELFDEIFGKDVPECTYKDGDPVWVRDHESSLWFFRYSNGKITNDGYFQAYSDQKKHGGARKWKYAMPFDPNNLPVNK